MSKDNYKTGYKKPPKKNQFKKGKSGNPKGRPKRKKFSITIRDLLEERVLITEGGKKKNISLKEAAIKRLITSAISGDVKSWVMLHKILKDSGYYEHDKYLDHELTIYEDLGIVVVDDDPKDDD